MAINFSDNIKINAGKPSDAKYLNSNNAPYTGVTEVNSTIPQPQRYVGLTVNVNNEEYWYEIGTGDGDLVVKTDSAATNVTGATNGLSVINGNVELGGILTGNTTINGTTTETLSFGSTGGYNLSNFNVVAQGDCSTYSGGISLCTGYNIAIKNTCETNQSIYNSGSFQVNGFGAQFGVQGKSLWSGGTYGGDVRMQMSMYRTGIQSCWRDSTGTVRGVGSINAGPVFNDGNGTCHAGVNLADVVSIASNGNQNDFNNGGTGNMHSMAIGSGNCVDRGNAVGNIKGNIVIGCGNVISGSTANTLMGNMSIGLFNNSIGNASMAIGRGTRSAGYGSFAGGLWSEGAAQTEKAPAACGDGSFAFFSTNTSQTDNHGALATASAILGGINHNIESGNTRATIIGGNAIKLTGTSYIDTTAVDKLAIMSPVAGVTGDTVLVRDGVTGVVKEVSQASIAGQTDISGKLDTSVFNTYTDTTAPATYLGITDFNSYSGTTDTLIGTKLDTSIFTTYTGTTNTRINTIETTFVTGGTNGLSLLGQDVELGGALTKNTSVNIDGFDFEISGTTGELLLVNGGNQLGIDSTGVFVTLNGTDTLRYSADYVGNFVDRSLVDKAYVDSVAAGLDPKQSVHVATTEDLGATYDSTGGTTGSGSFSGAPLSADTHILNNGERVLVKDQADARENGIYIVVSSGNWERATDHDGTPANEVSSGNFTFVQTGATLAGTGWVLGGLGILDLNTDNLDWVQFSAANSYISGDGIDITGNTISTSLAANSGLDYLGGDLRINPTIAGNGLDITSGVISVTANNGLTVNGDNVTLGGTLTGNTTINTTTFSVVMGTGAISATGVTSFAQGFSTRASGDQSHAEGYNSCSMAWASHAEGYNTRALGNKSHAQNSGTNAIGFNSHAEGSYTYACGTSSHAEGNSTEAIGECSHAEGRQTYAIGDDSHTEGRFTRATGTSSHAEGNSSYSIGEYSHAEGRSTRAFGRSSHSQNEQTCAIGRSSHSGGLGLYTGNKQIFSSGCGSFNHSTNNASQISGHGALSNFSAILGGINHNIESGNTGAVIIGGSGVKLTGTTYIDHTAVSKLAIMSPVAGTVSDTVLVRDSLGRIKEVSQASIAGQTDISGKLDTSVFNTYTDTTAPATYLGIIDFNSYSGTTDTLIGTKLDTSIFTTYTGTTNTLIGTKLDTSIFTTYTGVTDTRINTIETTFVTGGTNGLTLLGQDVELGSALTKNTTIDLSGNGIAFSTGATIADYVVVENLALNASPDSGTITDSVLVWNSGDKRVKQLAASNLGEDNNSYLLTGITSSTLTANQYVILVDTSTAVQTVTLPSAPVTGQAYKIKDKGNALTNTITIDGNGNNIDGASSATINTDYGALEIVFDGTEWFTLAFIN